MERKYAIFVLLHLHFALSAQKLDNSKPKGDAFVDYLSIYQQYISGIKASECGMTPSCSNFAIHAFRTHNAVTAFALTTDRLLRCGHDYTHYNLNISNKHFKAIDNVADSANAVTLPLNHFAFADTSHLESLKFIRYLMNKKFYNQGLLKIQELIYANKIADRMTKRELYINYIRCLSALDKVEEALFEYEVSFPKAIKEESLIRLEIAICHIQLKNYTKSQQILTEADKDTSDANFHARTTMLQAKICAHEYKWQAAQAHFESIHAASAYRQQAEKNLKSLETAAQMTYKKPVVAGLLGIIPGCGYLYAGHKQTALSALLINAIFGYATYSSIKSKNYGVAALAGTLSLAFYVGNIQGGIKSARRYNAHKKEELNNRIYVDFNY